MMLCEDCAKKLNRKERHQWWINALELRPCERCRLTKWCRPMVQVISVKGDNTKVVPIIP